MNSRIAIDRVAVNLHRTDRTAPGWYHACAIVAAFVSLATVALSTGCRKQSTPPPQPNADSQPTPESSAEACTRIPDWPAERIPMPPEWAPDLPKGYELLRFSPGMYNPESDDYFSYIFALMWERHWTPGQEQLTEIIVHYYRGLTKAVAAAKKLDIPADDVSVKIIGTAPNFRATVEMYEPFVTGERISLKMDLTIGVSCLAARVSPKARDHRVWGQLATAAACLPCP